MANRRQATLTDWCIVKYPEIYANAENPANIYAKFAVGQLVVLLGRAVGDPRYNPETGAYKDGHMLITSLIIEVDGDKYITAHTIYTLNEIEKNEDYQKWCDNQIY